jgi:RND family efflux transporter MFP subunit
MARANGLAIEAKPFDQAAQFPVREAFAQVISLNESRLAVQASAVVQQWHADVGDSVRLGELLLTLDDQDARLTLAQAQAATGAAQARADLAQTHLNRAKDLTATGFVSQEALSLRQTEVALAQAELANAQAHQDLASRQLEKMRLLAPFDGVVLERHAQVGEKLALGTLAFVLTDPSAIEVQAQLSAEQITSLQGARAIELAINQDIYPLVVLRISPVAVLPSRTQTVRLGFVAEERSVAGATGQLRWQVGQPLLSADLLVRRDGQLGIFVLDPHDDHWRVQFVAIEQAQEGRRALAPAMAADTLIVTSGQQRLQAGQVLEQSELHLVTN